MNKRDVRLLVGTYTRLGGAGLVPLTLRGDTLETGPAIAGVADASFGLWSGRWRRFFLAVERTDGAVIVCNPADWSITARGATHGAAPCHLALDPGERLLAIANYESGSVALFRIDGGGPEMAPEGVHRLTGHGPHPDRQTGPHAHWVGFGGDGRWLYVVDLGADRILRFPVDAARAALGEPVIAYAAPAGSGPRHLAFHPTLPRAFLVSELASTLTVLDMDEAGGFTAVQTLFTLPATVDGSLSGAIVVNAAGDRLYVTNRGHDSIATFALDAGGARLIGHVASGGASPRFLLLIEEDARLIVANEEGGTVCGFRLAADGCPIPTGPAATIPGAVFLARLPG